ncbi:Bacterial extracellular solute-binding protein, family 7 [compost metagenome]
MNRQAEAANQADRQRIEASGRSRLITLDEQQREAWRQAMRPVWQQFEAQIGSDVLKAAQTVNRKQRN